MTAPEIDRFTISIRKRRLPYHRNLLLAIDNLFFAAIWGWDCDCSASAALGEIMWTQYRGQKIPKSRLFLSALQRSLDKLEKDHCLKAYAKELRKQHLPVPYALARRTGC